MAGAPTKYKDDYAEQAFQMALLGLTDDEMAGVFGVTEKTFNNWKHAHPEFFQSIKRGKIPADAKVAAKLYERALGYSHPEDKIFCTDGRVTVEPTIKHYPPDTAAAFIWLKNRAGWKDKQHIEEDGERTVNVKFSRADQEDMDAQLESEV